MNTITIPARVSSSSPIRVSPPTVSVEGQHRPDLVLEQWQAENAPEFGFVRLVHADAPADRLDALPPLGARLTVEADGVSFDGIVTTHLAIYSGAADSAGLEARHVLWHWLAHPVHGRWQASGSDPVWDSDAPVAFNAPGALASRRYYEPDGRSTRIFDASDSARRWSAADILTYLLASHLPLGIHTTGLFELDELAGWVFPERVNVTGQPLREALAEVAEIAGLSIRHGESGDGKPRLVFYRPGMDGRHRRVTLCRLDQRAAGGELLSAAVRLAATAAGGEPLSPEQANVKRASAVTAVGAPKRYEATVKVQRGWDRSLETARYRDFVRSQAENWPAVADVFRKWVLNESGRCSQGPFSVPVFDFGSIGGEDFFLAVPRRIEPCLSADKSGTSRGIVVELRISGGPWRRYPGTILADSQESAIYLTDDHLPGEYFQAAVRGQVELRVTGTFTADARVKAEVQDRRIGSRVLMVPSARWEKVHASSIFAADAPSGGIVNDDTAVLAVWAQRALLAGVQTQAELVVALVDPTLTVGDRIAEIDGGRIPLSQASNRSAFIQRVCHRFGDQWITELQVNG